MIRAFLSSFTLVDIIIIIITNIIQVLYFEQIYFIRVLYIKLEVLHSNQ